MAFSMILGGVPGLFTASPRAFSGCSELHVAGFGAEVSISRCHATIRFSKGQFLLQDNNSKFGTLVAMKKPRQLEPGKAISYSSSYIPHIYIYILYLDL